MFPFFIIAIHYLEKEIEIWLQTWFSKIEYADCFLVNVDWDAKQKKMVVYIDCDQGLTLHRCQSISKYLAAKLDATDLVNTSYRLDVSSPGLEKPLQIKRQYYKNVGRDVRIELNDQTIKSGKLIKVDDEKVTLEIKEKERKKKTSIAVVPISWAEIEKTFVEIRFKN